MVEQFFNFDRSLSLQELERFNLQGSECNSNLILTCQKLIQKPIRDFSTEDLRIMIGQNIGLKYLIPLSIELLEDNLFIEGDLFPGDLLDNVLKADIKYWQENPHLRNKMEETIANNIISLTNTLEVFRQRVEQRT